MNNRLGRIGTSFLAGQAIFFIFGYDQWGLFMRPKVQLGLGQQIASLLYPKLPPGPRTAWALKALEVLTDAGKIPLEGALFKKRGVVPDGIAALVTQPVWSGLETIEKILGAALHPERVPEAEQVKVSLGCIYGSLFRYALTAAVWAVADAAERPRKL